MRRKAVESAPARMPASARMCAVMPTVVVLPSVPVTAMTVSFRAGNPYTRAATKALAWCQTRRTGLRWEIAFLRERRSRFTVRKEYHSLRGISSFPSIYQAFRLFDVPCNLLLQKLNGLKVFDVAQPFHHLHFDARRGAANSEADHMHLAGDARSEHRAGPEVHRRARGVPIPPDTAGVDSALERAGGIAQRQVEGGGNGDAAAPRPLHDARRESGKRERSGALHGVAGPAFAALALSARFLASACTCSRRSAKTG